MEKKVTKNARIQLELPEKSYERLLLLKEKTEASSYAEVMKNALRLYESIIIQHEGGRRLCLRSPDGEITEYDVF